MTPVMYARLRAALDFVLEAAGKKADAKEAIATLVSDHRAFFRRGNTNELRVAGVTATCTHSEGDALLAAWRSNAIKHLLREGRNVDA